MRTPSSVKSCIVISTLSMAAFLGSGCANTIQYGESGKAEVISTTIGDPELRDMAGKVTESMINNSVVMSYTYARRPLLGVDALTDRTGRALEMRGVNGMITEKLQAHGTFRLVSGTTVANTKQRLHLQSAEALELPANAHTIGKNLGADLFLYGDISEVIRTQATHQEIHYRISMKLLDTKTGSVVWQEDKEFEKSRKKIVFGI